MVKLITKPYVKIFASSMLDPDALIDFAENHDLSEIGNTDGTPLSNIIDAAHKNSSHVDYLSEFSGRFCYRSWDKGRNHKDYITNILNERHGSVFGHGNVSFVLTGISRSLSLELIRHHVGTNPSQESQRYVTAEGGELEVIGFKATAAVVPPMILQIAEKQGDWVLSRFKAHFSASLLHYHDWLDILKDTMKGEGTIAKKRANEAARCFLPNATETRMVWTMNMRAARNVIEQRGNPHADLEIRRLAVEMSRELKRVAPETFYDVTEYVHSDGFPALQVQHSKV